MAYQDNVEIFLSSALKMRMTACVALEGWPDPMGLLAAHEWELAGQPGWSAAWASGRLAHPSSDDLGVHNDVITDGMILSAVQAIISSIEESSDPPVE